MQKILNLTQHNCTAEQAAAGVIDFPSAGKDKLKKALTFDVPPTQYGIYCVVSTLAGLVLEEKERLRLEGVKIEGVMIGGALWLMGPLAYTLKVMGLTPMFSFSVRESVDTVMPDGTVKKVATFKHVCWVPG